MKNFYLKKLVLTFLLLCIGIIVNAYNCKVNGIYYNLRGNEAEVTYYNITFSTSNIKSCYNKDAYTGLVNIPSTITYNNKEYKVTSIGDKAFYCCFNLTSVEIPNSVSTIGNDVFWRSGLKYITIPNSITEIHDYAFEDCYNLERINLPGSITRIGSHAFDECSSLKFISIPNNVSSIGESAFYNVFRDL